MKYLLMVVMVAGMMAMSVGDAEARSCRPQRNDRPSYARKYGDKSVSYKKNVRSSWASYDWGQ